MEEIKTNQVSPLRLRIGVMLILLWWLPFWLLSPYIADLIGTDGSPSVASITTVIVVIQTIIGFLGIFVAGKEVKTVINGTSKKQAISQIWYMLIHGEFKK